MTTTPAFSAEVASGRASRSRPAVGPWGFRGHRGLRRLAGLKAASDAAEGAGRYRVCENQLKELPGPAQRLSCFGAPCRQKGLHLLRRGHDAQNIDQAMDMGFDVPG
jgi:hypothetical protein